jgi:hypothetical protein
MKRIHMFAATPLFVLPALLATPVTTTVPSAPTSAQQAIIDARVSDSLLERASRAADRAAKERAERLAKVKARQAAAAKAKREAAAAKKVERKRQRSSASVGSPAPKGVAQAYAKSLVPASQFGCLVKLWDRESNWRTTATGSMTSNGRAYGIPQALPGSKMASAGADWRTNYKTQIKWGLKYIKSRYGTPCGAWSAFQGKGWY